MNKIILFLKYLISGKFFTRTKRLLEVLALREDDSGEFHTYQYFPIGKENEEWNPFDIVNHLLSQKLEKGDIIKCEDCKHLVFKEDIVKKKIITPFIEKKKENEKPIYGEMHKEIKDNSEQVKDKLVCKGCYFKMT